MQAQASANVAAYVHAILKDTTDTSSIDVGTYVLSKTDALLAVTEMDTDVEGAFKLLLKATGAKHVPELLPKLTKDTTNATLKLRILAEVFNSLPASDALRFQTLVAIINYAGATNQIGLVKGYFNEIDALLAGVASADRQRVYLSIADLLEKEADSQTQSLLFLEKYLNLFEAEKDVSAAKPVAIRAAVAVVKAPLEAFVAHVELLHLKAVQQLKGADKIFDLLEIFTAKTLADFVAFEKASPAVLTSYGLDREALVSHMRLLTLCSYPTGHDAIAYADIERTLQVPAADVEQWVVKAITANLIHAKIDQLGRSVTITRSLQRGFGPAEWASLHTKLSAYQANVGNLLATIRSARAQQQK
ncbi:carbohydrate-binding protein [Achlya hypogyna]|uniref:Carbohydrate-binding protein n=1 Tax=Achlya hypogyna TaxID=1202772 RepID=A0A1V9ZUB7_ACHHY|nr:carbohydrate-binding protein [Achlya hypogyna]